MIFSYITAVGTINPRPCSARMPRPCLWLTSVTGQSVSQSFLKAVAQAISWGSAIVSLGSGNDGLVSMVIGRRWTCCGKGQERYRESLRLLCFTELSKSNCGLPPDSEQYSEPRTLDSLCSMMLRPAQCWSFSIILVFVLELCLRMLVPKYGWPVSCSSWLDRSILDIIWHWPNWGVFNKWLKIHEDCWSQRAHFEALTPQRRAKAWWLGDRLSYDF